MAEVHLELFDVSQLNTRADTAWASRGADGIVAAYPAGQQFGFVAAAIAGNATPGSPPVKDRSSYKSLRFEIRGVAGGAPVEIGIKDADDPDNGTEITKSLALTNQWSGQSMPCRYVDRRVLRPRRVRLNDSGLNRDWRGPLAAARIPKTHELYVNDLCSAGRMGNAQAVSSIEQTGLQQRAEPGFVEDF
jgi:hypothetical protein